MYLSGMMVQVKLTENEILQSLNRDRRILDEFSTKSMRLPNWESLQKFRFSQLSSTQETLACYKARLIVGYRSWVAL